MTTLRGGILISLAHLCSFSSAGWLVTRYYEVAGFEGSETTISPNNNNNNDDDGTTSTVFVSPAVDEPSALTTETTPDPSISFLSYVDIQLAPSQGDPVPEQRLTTFGHDESVDYYIIMTYTWAASCSPKPTSPTTTRSAIIDIPTQALPQVTPTSVRGTTYTTTTPSDMAATTITRTQAAFLDPSDVPADVVSSARTDATPLSFDNCGKNPNELPPGCRPYRFTAAGREIGRGYCCPDGCHSISGMTVAGVVLTAGFSLFGFFLLMGLLQSVSSFRKLMTGQQAERGLPYFFCCLIPVVTCPLLFFTRFGFRARPPADQVALRAEWAATPFKTKFRLWLKYGFRYKYPPMLGTPVPPRISGQAELLVQPQEELSSRPSSPSTRQYAREPRSPVIESSLARPPPSTRPPSNRPPSTLGGAAPPPPYSAAPPPRYETTPK